MQDAQSDSLSQESGWFGSCCVNHEMCDRSEMSQDHEILPGTVAHLCYGRGREERGERVAAYHEDTWLDRPNSGNGADKTDPWLHGARFTEPSVEHSSLFQRGKSIVSMI